MRRLMSWIMPSDSDLAAARRGTYMGFIPLALGALAAFKAIKGGVDAWQQKRQAGETNKANAANAKNTFESGQANERNMEDTRLAKMQGIGEALSKSTAQNSRALSPEVLAQLLTRRRETTRMGVPTKINTNFGSNLLGVGANIGADLAGNYLKGLGGAEGISGGGSFQSGAMPTTLAPKAVTPFQAFDLGNKDEWRLK